MKRLLLLLFVVAMGISAMPPRKHEARANDPDRLPVQAPAAVAIAVPEVIVPALRIAIAESRYGTTGVKLVETAKRYLGCRYGSGCQGPDRFDCSGLTSWVYGLEGVKLTRSSRSQYEEGIAVYAEELMPGDLVFFARGGSPSSIYHVGIVVDADGRGGFRFIHSSNSGVVVSSSDEDYYARHYYGARRILTD
ncbi:MAG: C40 family peptidase [Bacteroidaceae bacterium]|nr:C40 family peptidase [Bacteroidaceae bacterium]